MPNLQAIQRKGHHGLVNAVVPSYNNPNSMAIVTGVPPAINGMAGNYYYDMDKNEEIMMNDPSFLRAPTILEKFSADGHTVAAVITKDKLRTMLGNGLDHGICFSGERAQDANVEENGMANVCGLVGRDTPGIYDPEASVFCIEAGVCLLTKHTIQLMYLTTTDYVQHKYEPGASEANRFYARLDHFVGALDSLGLLLGITEDHGMNAKVKADGSPKVEIIEDLLIDKGIIDARVILPIADPYVVHHGSLGSYATVYLFESQISLATEVLRKVDGVELVLTRAEAVARFELPANRVGDLVVLSDQDTVQGHISAWHDLSSGVLRFAYRCGKESVGPW